MFKFLCYKGLPYSEGVLSLKKRVLMYLKMSRGYRLGSEKGISKGIEIPLLLGQDI